MFAVLQPPIFGPAGSTTPSQASPVLPTTLTSPYRPVRPSPLSSSPLRASSPPPSSQLLSQHDTQSSPIQPASSSVFSTSTAQPWFSIPAFTPFAESVQSAPSVPSPTETTEPAAAANPAIPPPAPPPPQQTFLPAPPPPKSLFRFSACPAKAVPRGSQNRDATRQTRRSLFLRNVRQRADDRSYERRNLEQELQKLEWWSLEKEIRAAKEADSMSMLTEHDFDDAAEWMQPSSLRSSSLLSSQPEARMSHGYSGDDAFGFADDEYDDRYHMDEDDEDERMADLLAQQEEAELEALIASMEADAMEDEAEQTAAVAEPQVQPMPVLPAILQATPAAAPAEATRPESMAFSDDGDYDAIFAELMAQQQQQQDAHPGEDMDMA